jgi:mannan endo-1,4-beta-mannosidase
MKKALILLLTFALFSCPSQPDGLEDPKDLTGASANALRLYNYILDNYFETIISGQQDTSWTTNASNDMIARVYRDVNKYPAIKGFDLIQLPYANSPYFGGKEQIDEAIEWWEGKNNGVKLLPDKPNIHGIVTFCWHWRVRDQTAGDTSAYNFYTYTPDGDHKSDGTRFTIPWNATTKQLDKTSPKWTTIISDLDKVAVLLKMLQDKEIPVLWRPLHEASGNYQYNMPGWFWWGATGPEPYIALWEFIYDYFTVDKELDNLIWVWNGQHRDWFPDPRTVDIVGYDRYANDYNSQSTYFSMTNNMIKDEAGRIVALSENGRIPDPDKCKKDDAMWSWFCTWNDSSTNGFWSGEEFNTQAHKEHVYNHDLVITLDELPDITKYRLE